MMTMVTFLGVAGCGALGGALVEAAELARFLDAYRRPPWSSDGDPVVVGGVRRQYERLRWYLLAVAIRCASGLVVAVLLRMAGPMSLLAAAVAGAGAYSMIDSWVNGRDVHDGSFSEPGRSAR